MANVSDHAWNLAKEHLKYEPFLIVWSDEDQCYLISSPRHPGFRSHGQTRKQALKAGRQALRLWLAALIEDKFR